VDITVYLPDEIGRQAKDAELNLSGLLRSAVTDELERREAMNKTLTETETYEVYLEDGDGRGYTGTITGKKLGWEDEVEVFLTSDERVLVYDGKRSEYHEVTDPAEQLRNWLGAAEYFDVVTALGGKPRVDL
jgi:hypothetical protein